MILCRALVPFKAGKVGAVSRTSAVVGPKLMLNLLTELRRTRKIDGKAVAANDGSLAM